MSRNAVILLWAWLTSGAALVLLDQPPRFVTFLFVVLGWIVSLVAHEFGHAFVAWKAGDHTVATRGYLSLDPLKYADPFTSLILPVIVLAIGGLALPGGAVYLREDLMRTRGGRALASLAGPMGTLAVLITLAAALAIGGLWDWRGALWPALSVLVLFQAMALIFNLLPVPGLDGWGVIRPFLPQAVRDAIRPIETLAIFALIAAILFLPGASQVVFTPAFVLAMVAGVDGDLLMAGYDAFRFWQ